PDASAPDAIGADASKADLGTADVAQSDVSSDISHPDITDQDAVIDAIDTGPDASLPPGAREYCETTREMFCSYYMRCGRMHAGSHEECLTYFDETCNAVYEPRYAVLEDEAMLRLSEEGIEACAAHLEAVECTWQIFDLDGPCEAIWEGLAPPTAPCGPGIDGFVCGSDTTCVLNLTFCGTCQATVEVGEACGEGGGRCEQTATCVGGFCVERGRPGDACSQEAPCALGASCTDGFCARFEVVSVDDACGAYQRCPYNAVCMGGVCKPQVGIDEACVQPGHCRSGYCDMDDEKCRELKAPTEVCTSSMECLSGSCAEGHCAPMLSGCFQ
ncbi:MAG: hypothetical protein ACNA8W_15540, partial [Bradymonadaceae bacterium]